MITEYGSVLTPKTTAGEARKAFANYFGWIQKLKWLWIVLIVIGAIGLVAYIGLATYWEEVYGYEPNWVELILIASAVIFAVGLVFVLMVRFAKKEQLKTDDILTNCEFFSDCIIFREFKDGEQLGVFRINYTQILAVKQREGFIYCTIAQGIAYPVFINGLSQAELNTIHKQLKLPVSENAGIIELKQCELLN